MKRLFLGLDTSNYTTSCAVCDEEGSILLNQKKLLPVKEGERGLRQSDAVFLHVKALWETAENLRRTLAQQGEMLTAVGYSKAPRDTQDSYMPCFLVGKGVGEMVAASMQIPVYGDFSHQSGHLMAAAYSACRRYNRSFEDFIDRPFLAFHVSGGTTDILYAEPEAKRVLLSKRLGGTLDIHAGQLIDRIGVKMGLPFPCGPAMDQLAVQYTGKIPPMPIAVRGLDCNLSGLQNKAEELINQTNDKELVSAYVLEAIARVLLQFTNMLQKEFAGCPIVYAGGVMSSQYIRSRLEPFGMFAEAAFASDNAAGIALLTREAWKRG